MNSKSPQKKTASGSLRWLARGALVGLIVLSLLPLAQAQNPAPRERAPERVYRDFFPRCDSSEASGAVSHDFIQVAWIFGDIPRPFVVIPVFSSIIRGIDATTGNRTWAYDLGNWHKLPGPEVVNQDWYWAPVRLGWPQPNYGIAPIDNFQPAPDLNGNGACDFIGYGWVYTRIDQGNFAIRLVALDGYTGEVIWSREHTATRVHTNAVYLATDFPTGMYVYDSPSGPRVAWKLTDVVYDYQSDVWSVIREKINVLDATDGEAAPLWSYEELKPGISATSTYFTGAADLAGDAEFELVTDDFNRVPPLGDEADPDGRGPPRSLNVTAYKGERTLSGPLPTERVLWGPVSYFKPPTRGNDPKQLTEEACEFFIWSHAYLVGDLTQDVGIPRSEFVGFYLTGNDVTSTGACEPSSADGRLKTHFSPVNGADGTHVWPRQDVKLQGWGFPSDLNTPRQFRYEAWGSIPTLAATPDETHPFLAVGTIDLPQPVPRGARYPPKDVRISVLRMVDSAPIWGTYSKQFGEDSPLAAHWALKQYAQTLAVDDYTNDGIRDILTPAQYQPPADKVQRLVSTTTHRYDILDSKRGHVVNSVQPWGPKGMAVYCDADGPADLTFVTGYTRRLDLSRLNAFTGNQTWRNNLYVNAKAQAQTAGNDMLFLGHRCGDTPDTRTFFGMSPGMFSFRRGGEIIPIYGYFQEKGAIDWILPAVQYKAPMGATLDPFLDISEPPPTLKETVGMSILSVSSGIGAAFGAITLVNRSRRSGGA